MACRDDFIPIEDVTQKIIYPETSHAVFSNDFIYFAARMVFLRNKLTDSLFVYAMSYLGNVEFTYSGKVFDALVDIDELKADPKEFTPCENYNLMSKWLSDNSVDKVQHAYKGAYKHFRPFAYNVGDVEGNGQDDFLLTGNLRLSSQAYQESDMQVSPESIFMETQAGTFILELQSDELSVLKYQNGSLVRLSGASIYI